MNLFTIPDVAELCGVSCRTACVWFDQKELPGYRDDLTGNRFVNRPDLLAFMLKNGIPTNKLL